MKSPNNMGSVANMFRMSLEIPSEQTYADWAVENLVIPSTESETGGPFSFSGREYSFDCVNDYGNRALEEVTYCFGSQTGKTIIIMAGTAGRLVRMPCRALWVMPSRDLARGFTESRWIPFIDASKTLRDLKPKDRHKFSKSRQVIGNSMINFVGSNSPANISSIPASLVNMDEVDKFNEGTNKEADSVDLAEQRTKNFSEFLKVRSSTPTISEALIWEKFDLGDQQRYFVRCFNCKRHVLYCWDKDKTILPLQGCEAGVTWDREAKKKDGTWDKERVMASARFVCPYCAFHILDAHKTWMNRNGEWRTTNPFSKVNIRSRHLSSLYSTSKQMRLGNLAVRWIELLETGRGVQAMVNGELSEPFEGQDSRMKRIEIIVNSAQALEDSLPIMTVDCQLLAPFYWVVVRGWQKLGSSRLLDWAALNSEEELVDFQKLHKVTDNNVFLDSKWNGASVYKMCLKHGKLVQSGTGQPIWIGWSPAMGFDRHIKFIDPKTKAPRLYSFGGHSRAPITNTRIELPMLSFNGPVIKDIFHNVKKPDSKIRWEVNEKAEEIYWKHQDSETKRPVYGEKSRKLKLEWQRRGHVSKWPDHLRDCEVTQIAAAMRSKRFPYAVTGEGGNQNNAKNEKEVVGQGAGGGTG